jgi:putative salt-induced outer membrane protein YdiY
MNCEELILSVVVIILLMLLMAFMCSQVSQNDYFTNSPEPVQLDKPQPRLDWGGVPVQINDVMSHGNTDASNKMLQVDNSLTAIKRLTAKTFSPPWSAEGYGTEEAFNPGGNSYITQHLRKRKSERKNFKGYGNHKNVTGVRYMHLES